MRYLGKLAICIQADPLLGAAAQPCKLTYVIKNDQWAVDTSDGVVTDARLDARHPGINKVGHGERCSSSRSSRCAQEETERRGREVEGRDSSSSSSLVEAECRRMLWLLHAAARAVTNHVMLH